MNVTFVAEETHNAHKCRCYERGREMQDFFETYNARVAHEVRAHSLESTHGLKSYVTTMTTSNVCSMCETVFFETCSGENSRSASFPNGKVF